MSPSEGPIPSTSADTPATSEGTRRSGLPANAAAFVQYVPTVGHVYNTAYVALEDMPSWGQEPPRRAWSRWVVTPIPDYCNPDSVAFSPSTESPPKQTAAKNVGLGLCMVVLGILMLAYPYLSTRVAVLLIGIFLVVSGIASLLLSVLALHGSSLLTWQALTSACHVILGTWMLGNAHTGRTLLVILIAVWIVAKGFVREVVAVSCVVAVCLVLAAQHWRGLPGCLLGYDVLIIGGSLVLNGLSNLRGGSRESDPLIPERPPPTYSEI